MFSSAESGEERQTVERKTQGGREGEGESVTSCEREEEEEEHGQHEHVKGLHYTYAVCVRGRIVMDVRVRVRQVKWWRKKGKNRRHQLSYVVVASVPVYITTLPEDKCPQGVC